MLYKIKSLKWERKSLTEAWNNIYAPTPFGSYHIKLTEEIEGEDKYIWGYCFGEYYDEESFCCKTIKEGKEKAQKHWIERIKSALEEVK